MSDDLELLKSELVELAAVMKPAHLKFANALIDGKTQEIGRASCRERVSSPV